MSYSHCRSVGAIWGSDGTFCYRPPGCGPPGYEDLARNRDRVDEGCRHAHVRGIVYVRFTQERVKGTILGCASPSLVKRFEIYVRFTIFLKRFFEP